MYKLASFKIPHANIEGLTNGSTYWVNPATGALTLVGTSVLPPAFIDAGRYPALKVYYSQAAQGGGAAGLAFNLAELWPGGSGATIPPNVANPGNNFVQSDSWAVGVAALNGVWGAQVYQGFTSGQKNTVIGYGWICPQLTATTWPSAGNGADIYVDIWGLPLAVQTFTG